MGNNQPRNICALSKYGNGATVDSKYRTATARSFGVANNKGKPQSHWYANCAKGDKNQEKCCSNSKLIDGKIDWVQYAHGNSCKGDADTDKVIGELTCVFNEDMYDRGLQVRERVCCCVCHTILCKPS